MEKKEINTNKVTRYIITGFVSYGIITVFITFLSIATINYFLHLLGVNTIDTLYITLPLMAAIILYLVTHAICKITTYSVFKKSKTNPENYKSILTKMNMFFITCIIISLIVFISLLYLNLEYELKAIHLAELRYSEIFSQEHITILKNEMMDSYNRSKSNLTNSTVIMEIGLAFSFISLIPYQKKMLKKYNEY